MVYYLELVFVVNFTFFKTGKEKIQKSRGGGGE